MMDIARNIDKSEKNESYVDLEVLQQELELPVYGYAKQDRLKAYWVDNWYCTDSWVGGRLYFFDDEPVAYSYQQGRKWPEKFAWFSREAAEKVRDFVQNLHKVELRVDLLDLNKDVGNSYKLEYNDQVLDWGMARYHGEPIELVEKLRVAPAYGLDTKVKIRVNGAQEDMVVDLGELDFLYHLVKDCPEKLVDNVLADPSQRSYVAQGERTIKGFKDLSG